LSKNVAVFVDVANLYYSARGQEVDVDYVALLKAATKGRDLIRAYAYSGLDPENENQRKFIDFLGKNGYKVVHKDIRKFGDGRVKANLDIEGDFAPAIRALQDEGVRCEVISFRPNTSSDLIAVADEFIDIMKIIGIGRGKDGEKTEKVMSAPPMPAKEVVPEFGFREAPASVAAAALAALREGKNGKPAARGRGRGRTRTEAASTEETAAVASAEPTEAPAAGAADAGDAASSEVRRRRRRRGGRGRGRSRGRVEGVPTSGAEAPAEGAAPIGWVELDDMSQIGEGELTDEPREYTFEEADPATLAELGLLSAVDEGPAVLETPAVVETPAAEVPAAKPRRGRTKPAGGETSSVTTRPRTSRRSARAPHEDAPAPAPELPADKPKARRTGKQVAAAPAEKTAAAPRRRTRAKASAEPPEAPTEGEPEGIWQRFRSGRPKGA